MKKLVLVCFYCSIFFFVLPSTAQSNIQDYYNLERERISKADSVEREVQTFVLKNNSSYTLPTSLSAAIIKSLKEHDGMDNPISSDDVKKILTQIKEDKLRELYFKNHPKVLPFFTANKTPETLAISCINGGFETGNTANYSFRSILASATPIQHLEEGCAVTTNSGAFTTSALYNQYLDRATLVNAANEPFLAGIGININQVHSGNYALKINPNPIDAATLQIGNVTSVFRDFQINANTIEFSYLHFGYIVPNLTHIQPFFRYRIYSINAAGNITGILKEVCIPMDFLNCQYQHAQDNRLGTNTLAYTPDWVCQQINTSDLIGQNVRLEFTSSDCEFRGHFSTVYIDDLCGTSCPPTWGAIHLDSFDLNCPTTPFNVCGNFQLPASSTLGNLSLSVLNQFGTTIGTLTNAVLNGQNFCFTVNPSIFGTNPSGNYTFQVNANLNNSTCVTSLTDVMGSVTYSSSNVTPTFSQIAPICFGDPIPNLPTTSINGIGGTWLPAVNNTATTTYTFTPSIGICASTVQMTIVVNQPINPTFNQIAAICQDDFLASLPTTSINNVTGTWSPAIDNTTTTTYTFTPITGSCANTTTMTIVVNPRITPTFNQIAPICQDDFIAALPTTSINIVSGTWSPALDNTTTTTYTFTPIAGSCANTTTMIIVVNPKITPTFSGIGPICFGDTSFNLPLISDNTIHGTWSPLLNNTQSGTYTFTPNVGECAFPTTTLLQVYDDFDFVYDDYCRDGNFYLKISPLNDTYNADTASYNWELNATVINTTYVFNVSAYLQSTQTVEGLPIVFDITVTNSNGCEKTKSITVANVFCGIQKGISVNGDGLNDFFDLRLLEVEHLKIFNRYGILVYDKANYYDEWRGQSNTGQELPDGVYYYVIDFKTADTPTKTGWIYNFKEK